MTTNRRTNSPRTKPTSKSAKSANTDKPVVGETDVDSKAPAEDPTENPEVVVDRTVGDVGEPGTEEPPETGDSGDSDVKDDKTSDDGSESQDSAENGPEDSDSDDSDGEDSEEKSDGTLEVVVLTAAFSYVGDDDFNVTAYKGDTIRVDEKVYARGNKLGAFA